MPKPKRFIPKHERLTPLDKSQADFLSMFNRDNNGRLQSFHSQYRVISFMLLEVHENGTREDPCNFLGLTYKILKLNDMTIWFIHPDTCFHNRVNKITG